MQHYYAAVHKDEEICRKSSSGGAFTAITDIWFQEYGNKAVVYGCIMDENLKARHIRAETAVLRNRMRGSKYVGSDMSGIMRMVADDLKGGRYVAFSGTPCQIAGLKSYLQMNHLLDKTRLLTIEVTCHGVGSVRFFQDYIAAKEKKHGKKVTGCSFRGKKRIGKSQQMVLWFDDGSCYESPSLNHDGFYAAYMRNLILRPSCYQCRYAKWTREADLTIADHWGEEEHLFDTRSLVISNSEMGDVWAKRSLETMFYEEITEDKVRQPNMHGPTGKPEAYDRFWDEYRANGYEGTQKMLGNTTVKGRIRNMVTHIAYWMRLDVAGKYLRRFLKQLGVKK